MVTPTPPLRAVSCGKRGAGGDSAETYLTFFGTA